MWDVGGSKYTTLITLIENNVTPLSHTPVHFCTSLSRDFQHPDLPDLPDHSPPP